MEVTCSAPGKLVLLGEYAVLFGHPAAVLAVNRRAEVRLRRSNTPRWSVIAPGLEDRSTSFRLDRDGGFSWDRPRSEAAERLALAERVIGSLVDSGSIDPSGADPAEVVLDTRAFFHDGTKLGLGSSAALTVALTAAVRRWVGVTARPGLSELLRLHRSFQGGRGSGIDLAASLNGGVLDYRVGGSPTAGSLTLPVGLRLVFVWTGRSASTSDFLRRLHDGLDRDDGAIRSALDELGQLSAVGIADLEAGNVPAVLDGVQSFGLAMDRLGEAAGIPILSDEHRQLRLLAEETGIRYKPSGAGGGDIGIGFTDAPDLATAFADRARSAGFEPLDLALDPTGLQSEIQNS
jgi:phosphomevalonate kinase